MIQGWHKLKTLAIKRLIILLVCIYAVMMLLPILSALFLSWETVVLNIVLEYACLLMAIGVSHIIYTRQQGAARILVLVMLVFLYLLLPVLWYISGLLVPAIYLALS
jgi:hypothetical protein